MNSEKEKKAIERLKMFEPESEPYYLCYSGGKDSDAIRILASLAGVKHEIYHNFTSVDAPETMKYIKSIQGVIIDYAKYIDKNGTEKTETMFSLIQKKSSPPTRLARYCCEVLKEHGGKGKMKITGVRWAESRNRKENAGLIRIIGKEKTMHKKAENEGIDYRSSRQGGLILNMDNDESRRFVESCYRTTSTMLNPIIDWEDSDVYEFLRYYGCKMNPLYQCGKTRIGCIGCPMQGGDGMKRDFAKYPGYKKRYIDAFDKMQKRLLSEGKRPFRDASCTGVDIYKWWVGDDPDQLSFFDEIEELL